jgi:hypothetical protein
VFVAAINGTHIFVPEPQRLTAASLSGNWFRALNLPVARCRPLIGRHERILVIPYVDYWMELNDKATVMFNPATSGRGSYLSVGAAPTVSLGASGATLAVATSTNFATADFYQRFDGSDGGSGLALVSAGRGSACR